jgi:endonuclease-3
MSKHIRREKTMEKLPFDIHAVIERVRVAVKDLPKAAMFQLFDEGFTSPFEQLVACMISIRTKEEVTLPASRRLFERARTAEEILKLSAAEIDTLIYPSTFHDRKALQILAIAQEVMEKYGGSVPCEAEVMMSFNGIGLKCANLTLGIACDQKRVSADIHVHRVTNRWGYIQTSTPERSSQALEEKLPLEYWVEINRLLVPFGKYICTGELPKCTTCPVLEYCRQVGVGAHR